MRRRIVGLLVAAVFSSVLSPARLVAQAKKDRSGLDRVEGMIQSIDRENATLTVRQGDRASIVWTVLFTPGTAFTYRNADSNLDDLKVGRRVIVLGQFRDRSSCRLTAVRIDVRSGR